MRYSNSSQTLGNWRCFVKVEHSVEEGFDYQQNKDSLGNRNYRTQSKKQRRDKTMPLATVFAVFLPIGDLVLAHNLDLT